MSPTDPRPSSSSGAGTADVAGRKPVRLLYCIDAMAFGGTEKQLAALIKHLDHRIVQPFLCTLRPSEMDLRSLGCDVLELQFTSFGSVSLLQCVRRLRDFVHNQRIDIVHAFFQDPTILAYLATLRTAVRARVGSFRDMGFWRTPGKVSQLRLVYPRFDGFVANSVAVAAHVHKQDRVPLEKIAVIYNGVRISEARSRSGRPGTPIVGIVANLNREVKRVDLFLRAARLVVDAVPGVRFAIVGDGHLRFAMTELAAGLGLSQSVSFAGSIPDPANEIQTFDLGVLTSDSEGLSNAILEYMAAGIPTVARRVGGNAELVRDGETGLLVDSGAPPAMAEAILRLVNNPELRRQMGARAREVASSEFSLDVCARRHEEYYERIARYADGSWRWQRNTGPHPNNVGRQAPRNGGTLWSLAID